MRTCRRRVGQSGEQDNADQRQDKFQRQQNDSAVAVVQDGAEDGGKHGAGRHGEIGASAFF